MEYSNRSVYWFLLICVLFTSSSAYYGPAQQINQARADKFTVIHQFNFLDFKYPSAADRQADIDSGLYVQRKPAPIDTDVYYRPGASHPTVFVTIPRFQDGIPATLGTIVNDRQGNPIISPYPSWSWQRDPSACKTDRIVSVYRVMIDSCDRLWVMDSGQLGDVVACPPQLLAFDLLTNSLISRYQIPTNQWTINSTLVTPIVEILSKDNRCKNTFVYMADCTEYGIVVYDHQQQASWKVTHPSMAVDPAFQTYNINGTTFQLQDGILGMALSPLIREHGRRLFYHAMDSGNENYIRTADLQSRQLFTSSPSTYAHLFHTYSGRRTTQSGAEAIDKDGVLFFGLMSDVDVACFVTSGEYGVPGPYTDIVASNPDTLQFISGMKIKTNVFGHQKIWIMSSRFQRVATDSINVNETNFRIQMADPNILKAGTKCSGQHQLGPESLRYKILSFLDKLVNLVSLKLRHKLCHQRSQELCNGFYLHYN